MAVIRYTRTCSVLVIRCGQDLSDEYGKQAGQDVKRGDTHTRLSYIHGNVTYKKSICPRQDKGYNNARYSNVLK